MNIKNFTILLCSLALACGCINKTDMSKPVPAKSSKAMASKQDHVIELISFIDSYSNLAPEMQKKVFAETNQALAENSKDLLPHIKLACMYALPSSRMRDNVKAQNLLQDLLQGNTLNPADSSLVSLLYEYTSDNAKQLQKSREDTKKLDSIQQKFEALEQKNKALEQKLNELKNIEKTMSERDTKLGN